MESATVSAVVPPLLPLKMRHQCQHIPLHCQTVHTSSSSSSSSSRSSASSISTSANHLPSHQKTPPEVRITSSTAAGSGSSATVRAEKNQHVVKIRISPDQVAVINKDSRVSDSSHGVAQIRICVNSGSDNMMTSGSTATTAGSDSTYYFNYNPFSNLPSGQISPSDTLDSGTCSDLDSTPPPLPTKKKAGLGVATATSAARISVTVIGHTESNNRAASVSSSGAEVDSDNDSESNISCDSLNSGDLPPQLELEHQKSKTPSPTLPAFEATTNTFPASSPTNTFLPQGLLQDIRRQRNTDSNEVPKSNSRTVIVNESTYEDRKIDKVKQAEKSTGANSFETDCYYNFHLKENIEEQTALDSSLVSNVSGGVSGHEDESFAGYKDLFSGGNGSSTIRSAKGTVRGVKNRVRAGIATFLQINSNVKSYKEKDAGKVVVYTTTMSVIRNTTQACTTVKQILRTLLVKFEERDVFMSGEYQAEIRDRMRCDSILVPQVFVDGQHIGDAETIERLNETGELRKILKPYKSMDACSTCQVCGGYRLLPCSVCNGSKKSVHRNHFTAEFVALKCMNCDEVGLVKCTYC